MAYVVAMQWNAQTRCTIYSTTNNRTSSLCFKLFRGIPITSAWFVCKYNLYDSWSLRIHKTSSYARVCFTRNRVTRQTFVALENTNLIPYLTNTGKTAMFSVAFQVPVSSEAGNKNAYANASIMLMLKWLNTQNHEHARTTELMNRIAWQW